MLKYGDFNTGCRHMSAACNLSIGKAKIKITDKEKTASAMIFHMGTDIRHKDLLQAGVNLFLRLFREVRAAG